MGIITIQGEIYADTSKHTGKCQIRRIRTRHKNALACKLYEEGILDTGYAAKSIGIERADFIMEMQKYGASIFEKTNEELKEDIKNAAIFVR